MDAGTRDLNRWEEFVTTIESIREQFGKHSSVLPSGGTCTRSNPVLFRGQSDSKWPLDTTLERKTKPHVLVSDYYYRVVGALPEIQSVTGRQWQVPPLSEIIDDVSRTLTPTYCNLPHYEMLVYLRHHGFPSPLLDWTFSPFIAAYFAFCDARDDCRVKDRVAIYAYIETSAGPKVQFGYGPCIWPQGHFVTTHPRHFAQKACYTVATKWLPETGQHQFCSHQDVVPVRSGTQDVLIKITMPVGERRKALRALDECNINHYTLFGSEDALVRTLAMRAFDAAGD